MPTQPGGPAPHSAPVLSAAEIGRAQGEGRVTVRGPRGRRVQTAAENKASRPPRAPEMGGPLHPAEVKNEWTQEAAFPG